MTGMGALGATVTGRFGSAGPRGAAGLRQSREAVRLPGQTTAAPWGWQASRADARVARTPLLRPRLQPVQSLVKAPAREELMMGAALTHLAAVQHENLVRPDDGAEAVRDRDRRAAAHQLRERALDL